MQYTNAHQYLMVRQRAPTYTPSIMRPIQNARAGAPSPHAAQHPTATPAAIPAAASIAAHLAANSPDPKSTEPSCDLLRSPAILPLCGRARGECHATPRAWSRGASPQLGVLGAQQLHLLLQPRQLRLHLAHDVGLLRGEPLDEGGTHKLRQPGRIGHPGRLAV